MVTGTQILAALSVLATFANALIQVPEPTVSTAGKVVAVVIAGLSAAVALAIQYKLLPEIARLKGHRRR